MLQLYRPSRPIQWTSLTMKGPDASDFLHRLTTVHVKAMKPGTGAPGFFLTAQGKIKAYFHLWMLGADEFFFEFDAGADEKWKTELLGIIDQFHFGEKFTLTEHAELKSAWLLGEWGNLAPSQTSATGEIRFFHHGSKDFGISWISAWGPEKALNTWAASSGAKEITFEKIDEQRISATRPRVDTELSENTIPLEVGLKDAISDNKGCYPGQEVIERIISLGSPPRRLARIDGTGPAPEPGEMLRSQDGTQEVGQITSVAATKGGYRALALVKKIHAKEGIAVQPQAHPQSPGKLVVIAPYA